MQVIIDRFEGLYAVIELPDRTTKNIPRHLLPNAAKEGDVLEETDGRYQLLPDAAKARADKIRALMDDVWKD